MKPSKLKTKRLLSGKILDCVMIATGIDSGRLSRIERDLVMPKDIEKKLLADYFQCKTEDLFND